MEEYEKMYGANYDDMKKNPPFCRKCGKPMKDEGNLTGISTGHETRNWWENTWACHDCKVKTTLTVHKVVNQFPPDCTEGYEEA